MDDNSRMSGPWMGLLLFLLISCGKKADIVEHLGKTHGNSTTETDFISYVKEFENITKTTVSVPVVFGDLDIQYAGTCNKWSDGYREVRINYLYWFFYTESQREILVFHELGHCVLNLKHDDTKSLGCPNSIMNSYMFSEYEAEECYDKNKLYYLDQFI